MPRCPSCHREVRFSRDPSELTPRETDVYNLLVKGKTNKEIGAALFIEEKTSKYHVTSILRKKGVKSRHQLIFQEATRRSILNKVPLKP